MTGRLGFLLLVLLLAFVGEAQPTVPPGPCCWPPIPTAKKAVSWWMFDEPSGTTSTDLAGTFNNIGTDHGAIPRVSGRVFRAIQLQGTQWVQVPNGNEVDFLGNCSSNNAQPGTITFWIQTTSVTGVRTIVDKRDLSPGSLRGYSVFLWNGRIGFQMATGTGNLSCNSPGAACSNFIATNLQSVADGNWHFVAISFSRCGTPAGIFYVDGQFTTFTPRIGDLASASDLFIGRTVPALSGSAFNGKLDELMFYKYAHNKAELDGLFAEKCQNKCQM